MTDIAMPSRKAGTGRLGIELQTVFGMPPVEYVEFAAELGCTDVSMSLIPPPWNPCDFPAWSLREDAALRRQTLEALKATGVAISAIEGFAIRAGASVGDRVADLDLCHGLGVSRINTVSLDETSTRTLEQLALLAELAGERDMVVGLEFAPPHTIPDLGTALAVLKALERDNMRLIIDAMHFHRSGGTAVDLIKVDPDLIACVQLCDVPLVAAGQDYMREACFDRLMPGQGELPLIELLSVLPLDILVGVEVPMLGAARSGGLKAAVAEAVNAARAVMALEPAAQGSQG